MFCKEGYSHEILFHEVLMEKLFLAADSGGSKTVWRVLNSSGETLEQIRTEGMGAIPGTLPINETARYAYEVLGRTAYPSIFVSLGGPNTEEVENALRKCWQNASVTVIRESSGVGMLHAAGFLGCTSAVLCGTGSTAVGMKSGRMTYAGGWGPVYADGGSGGGLCKDALTLFLRTLDGDGCESDLAPVFSFITEGLDTMSFAGRMEAKSRAVTLSRRELSALLPGIYELYRQCVPTAVSLFNDAIDEICRLAGCVTDNSPESGVLLCGGFFRNKPEFVELCRKRFAAVSSAKLVYDERFDPIVGVCTAAIQSGGIEITQEVFENILNEKRITR